MQVQSPVAYVRQSGTGKVVQLHEGDSVPDDADTEHVAFLTERGVLAAPKEVEAPQAETTRGRGKAGA